MSPETKLPIDRRRLIDLVVRAVLAATFAFAASGYFRNAFNHLKGVSYIDIHVISQALSILAIGLYTFLIACLYVLRLQPINASTGFLQRCAAIGGGFLISALLFLPPRGDLPLSLQILASFLVLFGMLFAVLALSHLGRSFSIIPEARRLVMTGPYRFIRHPLYLAEAAATIGALITFFSPLAIVIVALQMALQLMRIRYEERVLSENFPEYDAYAGRTWRLIPGLY